jgi:hypothetical protein
MTRDDRLEALIRASVDAEVRDLSVPDDLARRVVAGSGGSRPWRTHLAVGGALVAAAAAVALVPVLSSGTGRVAGPSAVKTADRAPFDPTSMIKIGRVPKGLREQVMPGRPSGFAEVSPRKGPVRQWGVVYVSAGTPPRMAGIVIKTGRVSLAAERYRIRGSGFEPVRVSLGTAQRVVRPPRGSSAVVLWEPWPGLVIRVDARRVAVPEVLAMVQGIAVSK